MAWEENYRAHELWTSVDDALDSLAEVAGDEQADDLMNLRALLTEISGHAEQPHAALTQEHLTLVKSIVDGISAKLAASPLQIFLSPQNNSNVASPFGQLAQHVRSWPATDSTRLYGLAARAKEVESDFKDLNDRVDKRLAEVEELAKSLAAKITEARQQYISDLEEQQVTLEDLIEMCKTELHEKIEKLKGVAAETDGVIEQQKMRLDAALSDHQEKFVTVQEDRAEKWSFLLAENDKKLQEHMVTMQEHEKRSQNVLSAIGVNATATDYGAYANAQAKVANSWRGWAVLALSVAAATFTLAAGLSFFGIGTNLDWWQVVFQKLGAPVGAAAVGYVLIRESGQHRKEERSARQVQLTLTALEPFIANLPEKQKELIRVETARRIFAEQRSEQTATALESDDESNDNKNS